MQVDIPMTINADEQFLNEIKPLLSKLEMWMNFQALKSNWYANEDRIYSFDFTLIKSLQDKSQELEADVWIVEDAFAYAHDPISLKTEAYIIVKDLKGSHFSIEQEIKSRLTSVANIIALQHGLPVLS